MDIQSTVVAAIGFLAQAFFSARIIVQLYKSEKERKIASPTSFWIFSLAGSWLMFIYGWLRNDFSILFGQFINYYIYIWNLKERGTWNGMTAIFRGVIFMTPVLAAALVLNDAGRFVQDFFRKDGIPLWLVAFGTISQMVFNTRFIYQVIYSARRSVSALPLMFWIISLTGSVMIIIYAIFRKDIVLLIGQGLGAITYLMNIVIGVRASGSRDSRKGNRT